MSLAMSRDRALEFADRLDAMGPVTVTRFFGGAGLVKSGVQFAFVLKGVLYLRVNELTRPEFEAMGAAPFRHVNCLRSEKASSFYALPDEIIDDDEGLLRWMSTAWQAAAAAQLKPKRKPRQTDVIDIFATRD